MDDIHSPLPHQLKCFMDQVRHKIRTTNLAYKTEKIYWAINFIRFRSK